MKKINHDFIKKRRNTLNLSLQNVAKELGFKNASTYFKYETGQYSIRADMLPKLSKILDCDIENFFTN
ncbi:TPA: helix-turn-helix transcriptional regulator [Clostridioides difficile]|uniref:helix-turn-helix domain-containing protein n=1 Tax=Clostridioides TaxID=1870884 RepID=UPI00038D7C16|nr:helix-turn-helix transcriptional regulator [Clostridioides difficile]MCC0633700.1 helix-turn-helix transcriptional regulator [Clostridioides sp. ZZV15-6388]MCC0652674.1 helix-turn-helix transcriptional regulator [Clostridioides sp. ES-S-0001-03]MCC0685862.1 helix-turn-helix transcriptional regulator [Clostridioides sp. ZZV14-6345]MCC0701477.1 helix-turn-helix transcriptional regulator [Clostridioides sp. ES-S-0049-02]MCC0739380.1 helix-turn-helix transcriptional regulator [Clostridioides sp